MTGSGIGVIWRIVGQPATHHPSWPVCGKPCMNAFTASTPAEPRTAFDRISLRRLVLIRSVAVTGQAATLLTVHFLLGFRLPLLPALIVVGCSVLLNLGSVLYHRAGTRLGERAAALYLVYDTVQLAVLLYLTGGLENPFSILMLAPVTVAATALSRRPVILVATLAVLWIPVLGLFHDPLPWRTTPFVFPSDL